MVLITGGLSGIGAAVAGEFAGLGARLILCDRNADRADAVVGDVRDAGGEAIVETVDVRDADALVAAARAGVERFGRLDVLVANAGIADQSTVADGDPERWTAVVHTNLLGVMFSARAVLPTMSAQGSGHIFIVASVSGRESYVGEPVYIGSKWGQVGFAHSLRQEVSDAGIRVSVVEPGIVDTPLTRDNPKVRPQLEGSDPLLPGDVARAIVFGYTQPSHVVVSELTVRPLRPASLPGTRTP